MADDAAEGTAATLDSLAPASQPAAVPAAPPPAAQPAPSGAPAAPAAAPAAPAGDGYAKLLADLGYRNAEDLAHDLRFSRAARAEYERARQRELANDPRHQELRERSTAHRQLMRETYSPEHEEALSRLPEVTEFLDSQRADSAQRDMMDGLREIGVVDDGSKEAKAELAAWENVISDRLNSRTDQGLEWNARYFGTPAERRAVVHEIIATEEARINRSLVRQHALTLREAAQRRASAPNRTPFPTVRPREPITATNPSQRRREGNAAASRQLDEIYAWAH